jgi:hypothetical protein
MKELISLSRKVRLVYQMTPSNLGVMRDCPLRGCLAAHGVDSLIPEGPAASVGLAVHTLLEDTGRGLVDSPRGIESRWYELIQAVENQMLESSLQRRFVPLQLSYPALEVVRIRAARRAMAILEDAAQARTPQAAGTASAMFGHEVKVGSHDGHVRGRIDRVVSGLEGPILQDFKSGSAVRIGLQPAAKAQYVEQLLLYSALYHETFGVWPAKLEIVPLDGKPMEVPLDRQRSEVLLEEARTILARTNEEIGAAEGSAEHKLARPAAANCRYCGYRPACAPYLTMIDDQDDPSWPADALGNFKALSELGNGTMIMAIDRGDKGITYIRGISPEDVSEWQLDVLDHSSFVAMFGLRRSGSPQAFEAGQYTIGYSNRGA